MTTLARRLVEPANLLSLVRVPLAALLWLRPEDPAFFVSVVVVAAFSDWADGAVGRRTSSRALKGTAHVGAWLDPVCDKIFVASAAVAVVVTYQPPLLLLALLLLRDVSLVALTLAFRLFGGRAAFHQHDYRATPSGKATTVVQFLTLFAVVFWSPAALPLALAAALIGAVAVISRIRLAVTTFRELGGSDDATPRPRRVPF